MTNMSICRLWLIWISCLSGSYKTITCQKLPRIAGGQNSSIQNFPFMVAIIFKHNDEHFCGGSIISKIYILTAAHCFEECLGDDKDYIKNDEIYVRVGSTDWNHGGQIYDVDGLFLHPKFKVYGKKDVAIIKIKGEFTFSDTVKAIPIASKSKAPSKGDVTLAGWGRTKFYNNDSNQVLQKAEHEIISRKECDNYYYDISSSHICTRRKGKYSGACPGDSGGPLIYKGQIIGIIMAIFEDDCLTLLGPNVHTKVSAYKKWIDTYLKGSLM